MTSTAPSVYDDNNIQQYSIDKRAWEDAISNYVGDDPLELWYSYICWLEQYLSNDHDNSFRVCLERCLSTYEHTENYKQDLRMVKLWIKYIDMQVNPLNLYQILYQRNIGTQCAQFYVGWAHYYDTINGFKHAESIFNLGLQAKASPMSDLQEAHSKFRYSLSQRMLYEDNSSKKRTASSLAEQRQQITSLSSPVEKKEPSYEQSPVQASYATSPETKYQTAQATTPQPTNPQYQYNNYEYQQPKQEEQQQQQQEPSQPQSVQYAAAAAVAGGSQSADNSLNNSAYVIASSLNSIYDDTNQNSYNNNNSQDVTLQPDDNGQPNYYVYENGAVLPMNFARSAKNTHEPWTVPLSLEEPFDANRKCMYAKHLVYPGDGNEYSLEEIRGRKWYRRLEDLREKKRLQKQQQDMEKQRQQMVRQQQHEERRQRELYMQQQQNSMHKQQQQHYQPPQHIQSHQQQQQQQVYYPVQQAQPHQHLPPPQQQQPQQQQQRETVYEELSNCKYKTETVASATSNITSSSSSNAFGVISTYADADDDYGGDIEDQIEASTISFRSTTTNGVSKNQKITIKFKKERPGAVEPPPPEQPQQQSTPIKIPKKKTVDDNGVKVPSKRRSKKPKYTVMTNYDDNGGVNNQNNAPHSKNQIDDANLLLSIANMHSNTMDDNASYSNYYNNIQHIPDALPEQFLSQHDDSSSYSNSEHTSFSNVSYSGNGDNSSQNGYYYGSGVSTPVRNTGASYSYSKSSTPVASFHNQFLRNQASNISTQNDDSMCSMTAEQNSFYQSELDEETKKRRYDEAVALVDKHFAKDYIDPFNTELCRALLVKIDFPKRDNSDNYRISSQNLSNKLAKGHTAYLCGASFQIEKEVGRGAYGAVYKAVDLASNAIVALKYQKPPNTWELYICKEVRKRLQNHDIFPGFMDICSAVIAPNASILVSEFSHFGSLLDINNKIRTATTKVMHESLVMHFTSQIFNIVHHLHKCKIIHADIKPDNFLLMKVPTPDSHVPTLRLIDFGCAIDMDFFEEDTQFKKVIDTDGFTCPEMLENRLWSYQTDLFCIAGTIHVMLFGEYMVLTKQFNQWNIKQKLPRYLKKNVWSEIFVQLLNIKDVDNLPNLMDLKALVDNEAYNMESELVKHSRTLSNLLNKR